MKTKLIRKQNGTCIAAIKSRTGKIVMAADRRASWDMSQAQTMPRAKLVYRNGLILAGTGDGFLCHLIVDILDFPPYLSDYDQDSYLHGDFYNSIRRLLDRKGMMDKDKMLKIPVDVDAEILIACGGRLYLMDIFNPSDTDNYPHGLITLDEAALPFAAGCGGQLAWGALLQQDKLLKEKGLKLSNTDRLIQALNVAADVSPGCNNIIDICTEK